MSTSLGPLFQSIIAAVKTDAIRTVLPHLQQFFADIAANPSQMNIVAKLGQVQVDLLAALPDLEAQVARDLAQILNTEITALAAQATPKPAG